MHGQHGARARRDGLRDELGANEECLGIDVELRIPNVAKARTLLGFDAEVELDQGLERTIAWYRARLGAAA